MSAAQLTEEQVRNWTEYALKIRCARCGEEIFGCEEEARDEVEFVANLSTLDLPTLLLTGV